VYSERIKLSGCKIRIYLKSLTELKYNNNNNNKNNKLVIELIVYS
jgi:hypothetical protein